MNHPFRQDRVTVTPGARQSQRRLRTGEPIRRKRATKAAAGAPLPTSRNAVEASALCHDTPFPYHGAISCGVIPARGMDAVRKFLVGWCVVVAATTMLGSADALTVVLADRDDPYRALAEEIAGQEALSLVNSPNEAMAQAPDFLLWVASPDRLSDRRFAEVETRLRGIPTGIITGTSLGRARDLYRRAREVHANRALIVNTENRSSHREAAVITLTANGQETAELTQDRVTDGLRSTDYVVYNGHGSAAQLTLGLRGGRIRPKDLPPLPPLVMDSRGCQTLRPWERASIALGFLDHGAAAYAGYSIPAMAGWGFRGQAPFWHTWPGFPVGTVVAVMGNALRADARTPCLHILGDPRIAFRADPPYTLVSDRAENGARTLVLHPKTPGVLPIRIEGGARYGYVSIANATSISRNDLFANARLQMADLGNDKFLLYDSDGRDIVCTLAPQAPILWRIADPVLDALDSGLLALYAPDSGTHAILATLMGLALLLALFNARAAHRPARTIARAILAGVVLATCHALYAHLRLDHITVTANPVRFYPASVLSTFVMTAYGAILYHSAKSWKGRSLGLLIGAAVPLLATTFVALLIAVVDAIYLYKIGIAPWTFALPLATAITTTAHCAACLAVFGSLTTPKPTPSVPPP